MLQSQPPMYLVDGQQPLLCGKSWAILAHSPNMSRYKEFLKDVAADDDLYFMPTFEREELMQLQPWVLPSRKRLTTDMVRACATPDSQGCAKACTIVTPCFRNIFKLKQSRKLAGRHHISMLCHTSTVSLLQVLQRFLRVGGVPRDVFKNYKARERNLGTALLNMDTSLITNADNAADTFSAVSHQLIIITVPAWRTGQLMHVCSEPLLYTVGEGSGRQHLCSVQVTFRLLG